MTDALARDPPGRVGNAQPSVPIVPPAPAQLCGILVGSGVPAGAVADPQRRGACVEASLLPFA